MGSAGQHRQHRRHNSFPATNLLPAETQINLLFVRKTSTDVTMLPSGGGKPLQHLTLSSTVRKLFCLILKWVDQWIPLKSLFKESKIINEMLNSFWKRPQKPLWFWLQEAFPYSPLRDLWPLSHVAFLMDHDTNFSWSSPSFSCSFFIVFLLLLESNCPSWTQLFIETGQVTNKDSPGSGSV